MDKFLGIISLVAVAVVAYLLGYMHGWKNGHKRAEQERLAYREVIADLKRRRRTACGGVNVRLYETQRALEGIWEIIKDEEERR